VANVLKDGETSSEMEMGSPSSTSAWDGEEGKEEIGQAMGGRQRRLED
jgi:hypothetical protein